MFIDPLQLIDETIDHLQTLAAHFEDETSPLLNEGGMNATPLSPDAKRCKEALLTINILIPKLRAARIAQPRLNTRQQRMCLNCED
jgi:hypothetical protein